MSEIGTKQQLSERGPRGAAARRLPAAFAALIVACLLPACLCTPTRDGYGVSVSVPALPSVVLLDLDQILFHGGFYYFYQGDRWYYSESRGGRRLELPRDRYPREIQYRNRDNRGSGGGGLERR